MDAAEFAKWVQEHNTGEEYFCQKNRVFILSCGTRTYTWFLKSGVMYTALQLENNEGEVANTIWQKNDMIHSLHEDIMLPCHALTDSVLIRYPSEELNKQIRDDKELSWYLAEHYYSQFRKTLINYQHATLDSSEDLLSYVEDKLSQIEELKGEKISDATLAAFMGMHRVSVSRIRNRLSKGSHQDE